MTRIFRISLALSLAIFLSCAALYANDAPHDVTNGISCASCHGKILTFNDPDVDDIIKSPFWGGPTTVASNDTPLDELPINRLCQTCHWTLAGYSATNAPLAKTHSSYHYEDGKYPQNWSRKCIECHDPHQQQQKNYDILDNSDDDIVFLATGYITDYILYPNGCDSLNVGPDTSVLTYYQDTNEFTTLRSGWEDVDKFFNKTYEMRGTILIPDIKQKNYTYTIVNVNTHANQIWVKGDVSKGVYAGGYGPTDPDSVYNLNDSSWERPQPGEDPLRKFGILYGQLIKQTINNRPVRFFDQTGLNSFADGDDVYDGVCQVCHTRTNHFRNNTPEYWRDNDSANFGISAINDSYYADPWHANDNDSKEETNCASCHHHEKGFAHAFNGGSGSCQECHNTGKHSQHLISGETCATCHDLNNMWESLDPPVINNPAYRIVSNDSGEVRYPCDDCHNNGLGGPPNVTDYRDKWDDTAYRMGCDGCHNGRPQQKDSLNEDFLYYTTLNDSCVSRTGSETGCDNLPAMILNDSCAKRTGGNDSCFIIKNKVMDSAGHHRLIGELGIRQYYCNYCHAKTVDQNWTLKSKHTNGIIDVYMAEGFYLTGTTRLPSYDASSKTCDDFYCHSDGTKVNPEVRPYAWTENSRNCDGCHGHPNDPQECGQAKCHPNENRQWSDEMIWYAAMPMYENQGPGADKANTHYNHMVNKGKSCEACHYDTIVGACSDCHTGASLPPGIMTDKDHIKATAHVNGEKTVVFQRGGTYFPQSKTCVNTWAGNDDIAGCHGPATMTWGGELPAQVCYDCHGDIADNDDYGGLNNYKAKISLIEWGDTGHGRSTAAGDYPHSDNPPANFPANGCWYCHDARVQHPNANNPFRLKLHDSFANRFEKECNYCHMTPNSYECLNCHNVEALNHYAPQIETINDSYLNHKLGRVDLDHWGRLLDYNDSRDETTCLTSCHDTDDNRHKIGSEVTWTDADKDDVRNQYMMMGVCLKCHDDDSGDQCTSCHSYSANDSKYFLGYDPGLPDTGFIKPVKAKASSAHFGYKHFWDYENLGVWKGGKFCWDCHDPHGDSNIYMIHNKVTLENDGVFGKPSFDNDTQSYMQSPVVFQSNTDGTSYAREEAPYDGICNVCHSGTTGGDNDNFLAAHYTKTYGDGHNIGRRCTECHEHRFTDSHSGGKSCNTADCHTGNRIKPVPRHTAFGLPRDCVKCHKGIRDRMDIMGQFYANSHHVQNPDEFIENKHCYPCHWESTEIGLINLDHHQGYNYKTHSGTQNDIVDLVVWGEQERPTEYIPYNDSTGEGTSISFLAQSMGTAQERHNVEDITPHCLSCHSEKNNKIEPFNDCKTPNFYSWDGTSIDTRYSDKGTTTWGKYTDNAQAAPKNIQKAFSAHGNAVNNAGGYSPTTGVDGAITNTRAGNRNVQCFDCHSSHGSKVGGVTSSYTSFKGNYNGANLKETQATKGGYSMTYKASANPKPWLVNAYNPGAGQCFDCHETANKGTTPWGWNDTFGASAPIIGYKDNPHFQGNNMESTRYPNFKRNKQTIGGHLKAERPVLGWDNTSPPTGTINGLCTPCHDPHGVTPTLGKNKEYAVPLLKGTWLTSPYMQDGPMQVNKATTLSTDMLNRYDIIKNQKRKWYTDRNTFGGTNTLSDYTGGTIAEDEARYAGLCLRCHPKDTLVNNVDDSGAASWGTIDRVHETVKGWGTNNEHNFPCSKCHQPHASGLPRLLTTNCLDSTHRGNVDVGGVVGQALWQRLGSGQSQYIGTPSTTYRYPHSKSTGVPCHESAAARGQEWYKQEWNNISSWPNDSGIYQWSQPTDAIPPTWGWPYQ